VPILWLQDIYEGKAENYKKSKSLKQKNKEFFMKFFLLLLALSSVSAKTLIINASTCSFLNGFSVNGSFLVLPVGDYEKNISGNINNGKWNAEISFDEEKTKSILIITNTSSNLGFNLFEFFKKDYNCRENRIRIKPFVFNTTPVKLMLEIEETSYKNIPVEAGTQNTITACLQPGKFYKINLIGDGAFFSFFYPAK